MPGIPPHILNTLRGMAVLGTRYAAEKIKDFVNERRNQNEAESVGTIHKGKSIVIVGNPGSGKTLLYSILGATLENTYEGTSEQSYPSFMLGDIMVAPGIDFGGGKEFIDNGKLATYVRSHDLVIFLFDVSKFTKDEIYNEYRDLCLGKLSVISNACNSFERNKVVIFGTHMGKVEVDNGIAINDVREIVKYKDYSDFFEGNRFSVLELQNSNDAKTAKDVVSSILRSL